MLAGVIEPVAMLWGWTVLAKLFVIALYFILKREGWFK